MGNNYKLRLYPIPAKGHKRVKVTIEELLHYKEDRYQYMIPFVGSKKIPNFSLHIEIAKEQYQTQKTYCSIDRKERSQQKLFSAKSL